MTANSVGVGFIGAGSVASTAMAPAVHDADGVHLQAVAARDARRALALQPTGRSYPDYAQLLADPAVDLVYLNLHNAAHLEWVLAALEAGKHVLCEKPLALDPAQLGTMVAAADRAQRLLVEALWFRWHPRTRRLEQLIVDGTLGQLREVHADFTFAGPSDGDPAASFRLDPGGGGGGLFDVGCYALSALHLALGDQLAVRSASSRIGPTGVDLEIVAELSSPAGALGRLRCGISADEAQVLRVSGSAGGVEFEPPAFAAWRVPSRLTLTGPDGDRRIEEEFEPLDAYRLMVQSVAARIRGENGFLPGLPHSQAISASTAAIRARTMEAVR